MKKIFTLCVVLCMSYLSMGATNLKHEFRATWLTTAWGNDWPKTKATSDATRKQQQDSLIAIFDRLQAGNMNAVCLQVRGRSDAFYQSSYEPWAAELAGARGKDPGYDPLAFAIEEAHKRGLELHAWVNPFRVTSSGTLASTDLVKKNAGQWIIQYNNGSFTGEIIDPGYPEAREYVLNVLMEIINNYDIDGIVMDDYFYPYGGTTTEDAASKALHKPANVVDVNQDGYTDDDWRRSNVDVFLKEFYNRIQTTKPWVRLGMGTFGIWTTQSKVAQAYGISLPSGISGLDDYDEQACNPVEWVKNGYVDYINPQLYWPTTSTRQNYNKLCQWWAKDVCEHFSNQLTNGKKVHFFSSQSISSNSAVSEIQAEIDANRSNLSSGYTGSVFFDTDAYLTMDKDLMTSRFATNALTPPMDWKSNTALAAPTNLTVSGSTLTWQHPTAERFTVYAYPKGIGVNTATSNPQYLQAVVYDKSFNTSSLGSLDDITIAVYTYDRYGVEHGVALYNADPNATDDPEPEPEPEPEPSNTITWELNGGEVNTSSIEVPSQSDLMLQFMNNYTSYFGTPTSDIDAFYPSNISGFLYRGFQTRGKFVNEMMLDESAGWKWLADYIVSTSASNTSIFAALNSGTEVYWRYSIAAFFEQNGSGTYNVDFSTAGQPAAWGTAYQIAHGAVLLPTYVTSAFTLPIPTHPEGHDFLGWYDNAEFIGSPLTIISADWTGSLYAKWQEDTPTIDPTWQITYTSSNDSIVTPYATDVFGANIVSNIYEDGVGTITFDGPVTSIGENAFRQCSSIASITIPKSVTSIGEYAFGGCSRLISMTIPSSVTHIGHIAFYYCSSLTSIVVEQGNTIYDSRNNCNAIIETATNTLVAGCQNTMIPNNVTSIGVGAFEGCEELHSINIPNNILKIETYAFFGCSKLISITIPNSVTFIGQNAFGNCDALVSITVDSANSVYDSRDNCNAIIYTAANYLSAGCQNTIIPNSVTVIGAYAFGDCNSLTSIIIPNSVRLIDGCAFYSCKNMSSITIPNSVTNIAYGAFMNCSKLDTIYIEATIPPVLVKGVFTSSPLCNIPCGTLAAYEASDWASQVGEFVEEGCAPIQMCGDDLYWEYADGVLTITGTGDMYDYAVENDVPWYGVRGNIKTINMPDEMTKIGDYAFYKCTALTSVTLPEQLKHIGNRAFAQDTKIAGNIVIPEGVNYIEERAFFNLTGVSQFQVLATTPPTLEDKLVFDYVKAPIVIPCGYGLVYRKANIWKDLNLSTCEVLIDNLYYMPVGDNEAHIIGYDNKPAGTLTIPGSVVIGSKTRTVTTLADSLFFDCKEISSVIFNEGLESIGERAFVRCGLTGTIVLPSTLSTIGERAFSYCDNVEKYILQAMTPPALANDVFTGSNSKALFYVSCEVMDDYKVATNWSSLKSRLRDACLNIYHYNTALGANGVHTTEDTLVASIYYRRQFTPNSWETLYLPFEVDRVTVLEEGVEYDLIAWNIFGGGHYYLAKPYGIENKEVVFGFTQMVDAHTPYIIQFKDVYYRDKIITFYGKESWNKLSTSFEMLPISFEMQMAGNTTLQDQILEEPVYMLRATSNFILQNTTTTLHPFECYVMPYATPSGTPARMNVRFRGDVPTAVESVKGNESYLTYTVDGYTLTVYPQGQAFSIYSLNGALIYSCEAGKEAVDCELNSGCYLLHAGAEAHKIML